MMLSGNRSASYSNIQLACVFCNHAYGDCLEKVALYNAIKSRHCLCRCICLTNELRPLQPDAVQKNLNMSSFVTSM